MKAQYSTVISKGQVTIPPSYIRNKLHLSSGSKLEFIIQDGSFIVVPINKPVKNLKGILPKPKTPLSIEDMNESIKSGYDRN